MILKTKIFINLTLLLSLSLPALAANEDNTKVNQREKNNRPISASQQTSGEMDLYLVSRIRKDIMAEKDISTYAKNIKIVALDGHVTVKGPVRTRDEAMRILSFAKSAAGVPNVTSELSVVPEKK